ncbi:MAG: hypothetical protein P1P90_03755 [Patescibacteria group bacterium]|nr:hypothetical protein [Patescibacteria group bacterium]
MNLQKLVKLGKLFSFSPDACVPEIPTAQDVLYALKLSDKDDKYNFCAANHSTYVHNVHLASAAVAYAVFDMDPYDEEQAKRIIADAIVQLCPAEARCTKYIDVYRQALEILGRDTEHDTVNCLGCNARE